MAATLSGVLTISSLLCRAAIHGKFHCPEAAMNKDARTLKNAHFTPDKDGSEFDF